VKGCLHIRSSQDLRHWTDLGSIFPRGIPAWLQKEMPEVVGLWAPDVSYFNGEYHVYYNGSVLNSQRTIVGLVTNTTLDRNSSDYKWVDRGLVLESKDGDDFNALDPSILVDKDGSVWLTYGSYWTGIKQRQIDPMTGMLLASNATRYELATRPAVPHNPIEGASLIRHGSYYYLFVSLDYCCEQSISNDDYKQAVGRSTSPHGPFVDEQGTPMLGGGATVLLKGNQGWNAPGGGTAYVDPESGDSLLIFHAQNMGQGARPYQWIKGLNWVNDWPVFAD
jgi:arabinan endo-1,5-alpha-L-arabinosidase